MQEATGDRTGPGLVFPEPGRRHAPADRRLREVRDYNTAYPLPVFDTLAAWQRRAAELRQHILVSAGLWPLPERGPLRPILSGRLERDGYSVEKIYFESLPGFFVTGNLYRPLGCGGPLPAILNPHGHSRRGRLTNDEVFSTPARCITFARQGYVAFTYDMIGYLDSKQLSHRFGGPAEHLWGLSLAGLQLWNSLRAVDFLCALPDVDPARIGCTGESGGGTQTFLLTAVDERIAVAAPVNMVSAHMQGGCLCENPPLLRVATTNVEIAALAAPRPLLLVSATGDWTCNTP
ncbi:MAG: alpha/beta hydrolase family protein, partial [Thermomicrobiales bacterium]